MRHAIYFEDMCCHVFVIKVGDDGVGEFLEKRQWNRGIECGDDHFNRYQRQKSRTRAECYDWIAKRSAVIAISMDTEQWTKRSWSSVNSLDVRATRELCQWLVSKSSNVH